MIDTRYILWTPHPLIDNADRGLVALTNGYTASILCKKPHDQSPWFEVAVMRDGVLDASVPEEVAHDEAGLLEVINRIEAMPDPDAPEYHDTGSFVLNKAQLDNPYDYAVKLVTGDIIRFDGISRACEKWVHLENPRYDLGSDKDGRAFERGMDVHIDQIVWAVDAPYGS